VTRTASGDASHGVPSGHRERVLLTATGVTKSYGGVRALAHASFALRAGEVHAFIGENGAGKSTLIKVLTGAVAADGGELAFDGDVLAHHSLASARALGIVAIYQQPALFPELTVVENLAFDGERWHWWDRVDWATRRRRAVELLRRVASGIDPDAEVGQLGMAAQQLVEIARALGAKARVLILDEPTASLTASDTTRLFGLLRKLRADGVGIIYITHRLEELEQIADRVTVLRDGTTVATTAMSEVTRPTLIALMVGPDRAASPRPARATVGGEPVLAVRGLGCRESGVHDVDLTVGAGEVVGVAGLVGAGRTALARTLFGLTPGDRGEILVRGQRVIVDSPSQAMECGLAYVPEDRRRHGVVPPMTIEANVTLAALPSLSRFGVRRRRREQSAAMEAMRALRIKAPSAATLVSALSGGNQQKVALARWLAPRPAVLILDEPTQGVDVGAKAEIHGIIGALAAEGVGILMISSEMDEILEMSDRVVVMAHGTIVDVMARADATAARVVASAVGPPADVPGSPS
jgi:rhamnose transport system ATP-binding protein